MTLHDVPEGHVLLKCECEHELQDKKYGEGMRTHRQVSFRSVICTSCGDIKEHDNAWAGVHEGSG